MTSPSLPEMRQQLKEFAAFVAVSCPNPQVSAADEMALQRFTDKVANRLVSRVDYLISQSYRLNSRTWSVTV